MLNLIDRMVGYLAPKTALRRAYYRTRLDVVAQFEGASKADRVSRWRTRSTSANSEARPALRLLRDRSRDLVRNNPYAAAAVREIPAHTVGDGIIPRARGRTPEQTQRVEARAKRWFDTPACDANGMHNFYGLENQIMRAIVESGEVLVRRRRRRASDGLPVPLQVQVLEADHLDMLKDGMISPSGNRIIQGVEFDRLGRRVAYWLYPDHPGEALIYSRSTQSVRVPAEDVLHIYRMDRPGQVRGVPWASPILIRMRGFDEYQDAHLERQKAAACYAGFIYTPPEAMFDTGEQQETTLPEKLEPALFEELPGGRRIEFSDPPGVEGYDEYSTVTLHGVSTGYGIPYFVLTGDLRNVNYSAGRMGWLSFQRDIGQWRWHMLIPQLCEPVWRWFAEAQVVAGIESEWVPGDWTPPRRELVDPSREIPAYTDAMRAGSLTLYENIRQQGWDPEDFLREVEEGNRRLDELGIVLDSDPRKTSTSGLRQAPASDDE